MSDEAVMELHWYREWARRLAGTDEGADKDLRDAIEELVKAPARPWRDRAARLGRFADKGYDGIPDAELWTMVLSNVAQDPTAVFRALVGERLGVDPRTKSFEGLVWMVQRAPRKDQS